MFGLFKKTSEKDRLKKKYRQLLDQSYKLSHTDRKASDQLALEADELLKKIDQMED